MGNIIKSFNENIEEDFLNNPTENLSQYRKGENPKINEIIYYYYSRSDDNWRKHQKRIEFSPKPICERLFKYEKKIVKQKNFNSIYNEIENSKKILVLRDNWDGEGGQEYKEKTWNKMRNFLEIFYKEFLDNPIIPAPSINPGIDGDIDIHWKTKKFEILLSIPESDDEPINYYGDDYGKIKIKGTLDINNLNVLISWIKMLY